MPSAQVLSHAVAALAGGVVAWLLLRWRHRQAARQSAVEQAALHRSLRQARDDVEALRPQAMQALQLETTLTLLRTELRHLQTDSAQALEASRRKLGETEAMASSLQQALVDARTELMLAQQKAVGFDASPSGHATVSAPPGSHPHGPSRQLDELSSRVAGIISASRKWQRGSPHR